MSILSGYGKFKRYLLTDDGYKLLSQWTSSNSVHFDDDKTAETKVGAIDGITDSLTSTNSRIALSAKSGKDLQDQVTSLNTDLDNAKSNIGATNTNIANLTTALSGKQDTADAVKVGIFYRTDSVGGGKSVLIDAATITGIASSRFLGVCPFLVTTNRGNGYGRIRGDAGSVNTYYIDSTHTSGEAIFHKCVYFYR